MMGVPFVKLILLVDNKFFKLIILASVVQLILTIGSMTFSTWK